MAIHFSLLIQVKMFQLICVFENLGELLWERFKTPFTIIVYITEALDLVTEAAIHSNTAMKKIVSSTTKI